MVDSEVLVESRLAHVIAVVLGVVGIAAIAIGLAGAATFWFWLFYLVAWATFLDLFDDDEALWRRLFGDDEESAESRGRESPGTVEDDDPVAILKRRYAAGEIDDEEFEARLDGLLDTPDSMAELETERGFS